MSNAKHAPGPQAYVDKSRPGIVRFEGADQFDGLLAGTRAAEIVKRWNAHADMAEALKKLIEAWDAPKEPNELQYETGVKLGRAALAKAGIT